MPAYLGPQHEPLAVHDPFKGRIVLGRWRPLGVAAAALVFGGARSLETVFQAMGWREIPYQAFLALPYLLTLLVLAGVAGRATAPAALGQRDLESR